MALLGIDKEKRKAGMALGRLRQRDERPALMSGWMLDSSEDRNL